jgi:hypothetical protein
MQKHILNKRWLLLIIVVLVIAALCFDGQPTAAQESGVDAIAVMTVSETRIEWHPQMAHDGLTLTIGGPGGLTLQKEVEVGGIPAFEPVNADGEPFPDGTYTYELRVGAVVDPGTQAALTAAREASDSAAVVAQLQQEGKLPRFVPVQSGHFTIHDGSIVTDEGGELDSIQGLDAPMDVPHYDDVIITGSLCVGFDCAVGESFGFDTTILKEHNLRIYFNDTSYTASYPTNNWRITVNDSTNGGASYFAVDDVDDGTTPFKIEAGAPSNSLYVEDYGRVGFGTSTPVVELHVKDSDTPTLRLEQDSSGGWTAQTWDVAGNESNFFIRDATNGSKLPFRIQPNAPSSSLNIKSDGKVGIGTWSPAYSMELETTGEDAVFAAERTNGATAKLVAGEATVQLGSVTNHDLEFLVSDSVVMQLDGNGNLTVAGAVYESSDLNAKENLRDIDGRDVLARLAGVPVTTWNYKADDDALRHMGPMAQDFYAAFGLGSDETHIAPLDANGVALVAAQELHRIVQDQDDQIAELKQENADLEARLRALETLVDELLQAQQD